MRGLRIAGIAVSAALALGGVAIAALDRPQERFGSRLDWVPGFSLSYHCTDARDQLEASEVAYGLRYREARWRARVDVVLDGSGLRDGCDVTFAVPRGSVDVPDAGATVSLERDGSPVAGTARAHVRPRPGTVAYSLDVVLPVHYDVAHSLGIGKHLFRFDFFGSGEAGSFGTGSVEVSVPDGYSLTDASPGGIRGSVRSRKWTLRGGRDFEAVVTFEQDGLRDAVELAPEVAFGAGAVLLALLAIPSRRRADHAVEEGEAPAPAPPPEPPPVAAPPRAAPPVPVPPRDPPRRRRWKRYAWLALVALPVVGRVLRRRR